MLSLSVSNTLIVSKKNKMNVLTLSVVRVFTTCVLCCYLSTAAPVITETKAIMYLQKYGYMKEMTMSSPLSITEAATISQAIKDFQRFTRLAKTGILDTQTRNMMRMPRCGVPDEDGSSGSFLLGKPYAVQGSFNYAQSLTYSITNYPTSIKDTYIVDEEIAKAFKVWSDVSSLKFQFYPSSVISKPVDIEISFEEGEHGDSSKFDGPGGVLAHAFFPESGSDVHFDNEEEWTIRGYSGINLFQVAAHEFGHSIGLDHSDSKTSVMFPIYPGYKPNFGLDNDDIVAVRELYGEPDSKPWPDPDESGVPDLCLSPSIDAATMTKDGRTYVFKGDYYWEITTGTVNYYSTGMSEGYPRKISDDWPGLPGNLDATMTTRSGKTYFFKENHYWRFQNKKMLRGYPRKISSGFPGIPNDIDAAFLWDKTGKVYFFKGDQYWAKNRSRLSSRYPQPISNWKGLPNNIDAAFQWTKNSFFFKGSQYYQFNDATFSVVTNPPYPRSTYQWWFDCEDVRKTSV